MHHSSHLTNLPNEEGSGGNTRGTSSHMVNRQPMYICAHCHQGILTAVGMRSLSSGCRDALIVVGMSGCAHCRPEALSGSAHARQDSGFLGVVSHRGRGGKYDRGGVEGHIWRHPWL